MSLPEDHDRSLARLIDAIRRGDRDGFDRLLESYRPLIAGTATREMSHKLRKVMEPEDVVQDVMLAAYRGMLVATFTGAHGFEAWLKTLVTNRLIDLERRHFKTVRRKTDVRSIDETVGDGSAAGPLSLALFGNGPGPSTIFSRREMAERLSIAVARCRPKVRALLAQTYVEGLSVAEIAVRQGRSQAAVRKALSRAVDECRDAFCGLPPPASDGDA